MSRMEGAISLLRSLTETDPIFHNRLKDMVMTVALHDEQANTRDVDVDTDTDLEMIRTARRQGTVLQFEPSFVTVKSKGKGKESSDPEQPAEVFDENGRPIWSMVEMHSQCRLKQFGFNLVVGVLGLSKV
eukprot:2313958-Amphidinium_carterae.1